MALAPTDHTDILPVIFADGGKLAAHETWTTNRASTASDTAVTAHGVTLVGMEMRLARHGATGSLARSGGRKEPAILQKPQPWKTSASMNRDNAREGTWALPQGRKTSP